MSGVNDFATQREREVSSGRQLGFGRNWAQFRKPLNEAPVSEADFNKFLGERSPARKTRDGSNLPVFRLRWSEHHCAEELRHNRRPTFCRVHCGGREFAT
jgi:hypothetical protein